MVQTLNTRPTSTLATTTLLQTLARAVAQTKAAAKASARQQPNDHPAPTTQCNRSPFHSPVIALPDQTTEPPPRLPRCRKRHSRCSRKPRVGFLVATAG
jgi:hypothetical protein